MVQFSKLLDISSAHITDEDNDRLLYSSVVRDSLLSADYEGGFFIFLNEENTREALLNMGMSESFAALYYFAFTEHKADLLRIDRDGDVMEGLEKHAW